MAKGRRSRGDAYDDLPKAKLSVENFRKSFRLFELVWEHKWKFILGMIFLLGTALVGLAFPIQSGSLLGYVANNQISGAEKLTALKDTAALLFVILGIQGLFSFGRVYMFMQVAERMLKKLRDMTYERVLKKPMTFFAQNLSSELSSRISTDINVIGEAFTLTIAELIRQTIVGIGGLILMIYYTHWDIAKWFLIIIPPLIIISILFAKRIRVFSKNYQDKIAESNVILGDSFTGINDVKTFTNEPYEISRYQGKTDEILKFGIRYGIFRGSFFAFVITCVFGAVFFILYKMLQLNAQGVISGEEFGRFMMLALFVSGSLGGLPETIASIQRALGATDRVFQLIDEPIEAVHDHSDSSRIAFNQLAFQSVTFSYPTRQDFQVLKSIDFSINSGETVALVGSSGSGKSTIANLLLRFYEVNQGKITLDGKNILDYDLTHWRDQIALVPQEILLFAGTISENIAYGNPSASAQEIEEAARKANALEFISRFPDGMNTKVGERGVQLSGGQRQRIAIARAVLKNPTILILDEATSSLDSESEFIVQEALDRLMKDRTSLVIAHRLSTIKKADKIIVLHQGEIVETGTHETLIGKENGFYKKLIQMQTFN